MSHLLTQVSYEDMIGTIPALYTGFRVIQCDGPYSIVERCIEIAREQSKVSERGLITEEDEARILEELDSQYRMNLSRRAFLKGGGDPNFRKYVLACPTFTVIDDYFIVSNNPTQISVKEDRVYLKFADGYLFSMERSYYDSQLSNG